VQEETAEERALLRAAERNRALSADHLELSEDAELELRASFVSESYGEMQCEDRNSAGRVLDVFGAYA
jgi:hypothetical protein